MGPLRGLVVWLTLPPTPRTSCALYTYLLPESEADMAGKKGRTGVGTKGTGKTKAHRTPETRLEDMAKMMRLLRRGYSKTEIAEELGVCHTQVSYDLKVVIKQVREDTTEDTKEHIAVKLAEYREIKREAWAAWERSKEDARKATEERYLSGSGRRSRRRVSSKEGRLAANEYLRTILSCLEAERELMSLNPTRQVGINGTVSWDILANGIPDGDVPDEVEEALKRAALAHNPELDGITHAIPHDGEVIDVDPE